MDANRRLYLDAEGLAGALVNESEEAGFPQHFHIIQSITKRWNLG
jgi:hypothetical protein